jgi:predicted MPP superfamily phosphohydrolase
LWPIDLALGGALPVSDIRRLSAAAVPLIGIGVTLLGFLNARRTARVVTVEVPMSNLPVALQGFTIVQISDIHVGPTIRHRYVEGIVEAVNRLKPDLVAITGDLVDGSVPELGAHIEPLSRLVSRHGSFFVTGNHEYYSGVRPWVAELERLGIKVLHNEHVVIERGGAKLVLGGVTDYSAGHFDEAHRSDPGAALAGAPGNAAVRVLLAHQPRSAPAAAEAGFDLQLSGHTHGGQFLPWRFFVRFQQPFTSGLHRLGRMWIYVSRGTGYWGPPKRFGAPSEITEVKLAAAEQT